MEFKLLIDEYPWLLNILYSLIVVIVACLLYALLSHIVLRRLEKFKIFNGKKSGTYLKLLKSVNRYLFIIILLLIVLKINGVNISSMVAGVGIAGVIFGFAIQDALKDVIKGIDIIADSYYQVGDVIRVGNYTGLVLTVGIKTTKIEDIFEKNIVSISNRNIEQVEVLSHMINIDIPLPYDLDLETSEKTIQYITDEIKKIEKVEKVEYRGVNELADSSIKYQIKVYASPIDKVQTRRDALTCIVKCLEECNVHVPFNQIDVHQK